MAVTTTAIAIALGASTPLATAAGEAPADTGLPFAVEDGAYPYRADILDVTGADLIAGDGNITYTSCSEPHQIKVWARNLTTTENRICFVAAGTGYLSVNIPRAFRIETNDRDLKADVSIDGTTENLTVPRDTAKGFGEANPADPKQAVLLDMRVTGTSATPTTPPPAGDTTHAFTGKLRIGDTRSCTAALVDSRWAVTAKSCFADNPAETIDAVAGSPKEKTTFTLGRSDLNSVGTHTSTISYVIPRPERDLALVRLDQPAFDITPVAVSNTAAATGEELTVAGYGRTSDEWTPTKLHTATFSAGATSATGVDLTAKTPAEATVCKGDAGAPALRTENGKPALVAVGSRSRQGGCLDSGQTEAMVHDSRVDDLGTWIQQIRDLPSDAQVASGDFNGDGREDVAAFYDNGTSAEGKNRASLFAFYSNSTGFAAPKKVWSTPGGFTWSKSQLTSGDYNGDGKDDIAVFYDSGSSDTGQMSSIYTFTSTGTGFSSPKQTWTTPGGFTWSMSKVTSGDYNGDGKDDIAVFYDGGSSDTGRVSSLYTFNSTGTGFANPRKTWTTPGGFTWSAGQVTSGDYNKDGKDDVAVLYNGGKSADGKFVSSLYTFNSNGTTFDNPRKTWTSSGSFNWSATKLTSGDYSGDGRDDVAVLYNRGTTEAGVHQSALFTFTSSGTDFAAPREVWASTGSFSWAASQPVSGDFDKDGKSDIGVLYRAGTAPDGQRIDSLFSFTSTGTGIKAPVKHWTGSVV
ncbi:FG-GAP-like repeat-containing protein [Streptomyces microflavus]|uniref:FG-GAP-like repeat-containing protein n=1 Tax=Streptomyces microflavus TaxID=1919 RepID=UPI0033A3BD0C